MKSAELHERQQALRQKMRDEGERKRMEHALQCRIPRRRGRPRDMRLRMQQQIHQIDALLALLKGRSDLARVRKLWREVRSKLLTSERGR